MPPPAPKPRFIDGEKVLCYHGPLIYEAKCLKSQIREKQMKYFIHYNGWNKNWDEWVPESRVLKYNEANLQKQKELAKTLMKNKKSKSVKVSSKKEAEKEPEKAEKNVPDKVVRIKVDKPKLEKSVSVLSAPSEPPAEIKVEVKTEKPPTELCFVEEFNQDEEIKIIFPQRLKDWLIDDWDLVTRQDMLLNVPARVTVDHVIANYVKEKVSVKDLPRKVECTIVQFANRIRDAFNILLGKLLLYPFERQQYSDVLAEYPGWSMCQIYGAIHLLRLLTELGPMLTSLCSFEKKNSSLTTYLNDFAEYMSINENFFSLNDYIVASPAYHRIG